VRDEGVVSGDVTIAPVDWGEWIGVSGLGWVSAVIGGEAIVVRMNLDDTFPAVAAGHPDYKYIEFSDCVVKITRYN